MPVSPPVPPPPIASAPPPLPPPAHHRAFGDLGRALFLTLTAFALPGAVLSTLAYFTSTPGFLAQLSPFRVQYAALLIAQLLLCLALRRPRWAAFFAVFAVFNAWAVLRPTLATNPTPTPDANENAPPPLKILLANVLTSNSDPTRLLALIATEKPDLVALLEIDARWQALLSPALRSDYPHGFFRAREDNFGLAVFSRLPPGDGRVEFFSDSETPSFAFTLPLPPAEIRIVLTHPMPPGDTATTRLRDHHLGELLDWVDHPSAPPPAAPPRPALILGDLNATPWCPPLRRLLAAGGLRPAARGHTFFAATWPVPVPFLRIPLDHALLNDALVCTAYRVGPDIGSDHFPLVLELRLAPPR